MFGTLPLAAVATRVYRASMTTVEELQLELAEVNTAISRITQSLTQEHGSGGDRHRAPDLSALFAERTRLKREIRQFGGVVVSQIAIVDPP